MSPDFIEKHDGRGVIDLRIAIDMGQTSEAGSDQPRLDLENGGPDHIKAFFRNESAPAGTKYDVFRASVARSSYDTVGIAAGVLSKIWWDTRNNRVATGYYGLHPNEDGHAILTHTYKELPDSAQNVPVGLDFMRYNEPVGSPEVTRNIQLQRLGMPSACLLAEATHVSMVSDQLVRIGACASRGADVAYSWKLGNAGAWTPFGPDTLVEYVAPANPGTDTISLRVRNNSGVTATSHVQ